VKSGAQAAGRNNRRCGIGYRRKLQPPLTSATWWNHSGFIGGGQIGYNWQVAPQFVLGVEWMFDGTSISKTSNAITIFNGNVLQGSASTDWVQTIAARFGYAANNVLYCPSTDWSTGRSRPCPCSFRGLAPDD
jgi:opacity protein-like surface antigen